MEVLAEIEAASHSDPWSPSAFRTFVGEEGCTVVLGEGPVGAVGFGILRWVADEGEVLNLAVRPGARRAGVGGRLLDHLLLRATAEGLRRVYLEVRASNRSARRLYLSRGFREAGLRRQYYSNPREDAIVLRRDMARPAFPPARPSPDSS